MAMNIIYDLLNEAIIGEKTAVANYDAYAEVATQEGIPGIATLFKTLAFAENVHAENHKRAIQKEMANYESPDVDAIDKNTLGNSEENLKSSIDGEFEEFTQMYPSFKKQIQKKLGNSYSAKLAILSIDWAQNVEKAHHQMLDLALQEVKAGRDLIPENLYVCEVCGNIHYNAKAPDSDCDVCGHGYGFFRQV